jgi:hypothetical protein
VVVKNAIVEAAFAAIEFSDKPLNFTKSKADAVAQQAGREAADRVNLNRPLTHDKTQRIPGPAVLHCPRCAQQLRVPTDRGVLRVNCPNGHRFTYDPED